MAPGTKFLPRTTVVVSDESTSEEGTLPGRSQIRGKVCRPGFHATEGVDFDNTYSRVSGMASLRALLGIVAAEKLCQQMDADTASSNGTLDETI
jgi:hypothetical protein